jgi:uncharacterized protein with von Willebrand factor type A (vWA) domain
MKAFRFLAIAATLVFSTVANAQTTQRGFSVVLLIGEAQNAGGGDGMPPAATLRKALNDVKDFLPYKSYRVLDTQWLRGGSTRMKGLDDQEYDVDLGTDEISPNPFHPKEGMLNVVFHLQEVGAAANSSEEFGRMIQVADMEKQRASIQRQIVEGAPGTTVPELMARKAQLEKQIRLAKARKLIDSRFEMAIGETVVVGTSKIGGGEKGLVVLLTSVAGGK